jgi:hypothetical protein
MADPASFEEYLGQIGTLGGVRGVDPVLRAMVDAAVEAMTAGPIDRERLADLIRVHPHWVRVLGLTVGLSKEGLKGALTAGFGTAGWIKLGRDRSADVVAYFDDTFGLVARLQEEAGRDWTFADVLVERAASSSRAGGAIDRGRTLENVVESVVAELGLPYSMRGSFLGRADTEVPCDLAIPTDGRGAQIVVAIKGFDSTGSKLTDAVREVQQAADWRLPSQYVFAVVDGAGWLRRQADLRRIHSLWARKSIDGLYTVSTMDAFRGDVDAAAAQKGLRPRPDGA